MVTWDAAADRALLLNVIDPVAKPNWDRVATAMGYGFTAEACRQKFRKLKTEALGEGSPVTTTTPMTSNKAKRKANGSTNGADETPTKKPRGRKPKAKEPKAELNGSNSDTDVKEDISANDEA
ncbi:hypothetical protein GX50_03396 [[Emmonsia] crescens]|uniref:Myb-like domain-containing protein n=1 Tax=[Emmonsia] crescens TaxID=73230 RepID=A0A2B7ZLZ4_9EURO|nr:hypothetical protein GX50_03396 [Emmonsia crescens]